MGSTGLLHMKTAKRWPVYFQLKHHFLLISLCIQVGFGGIYKHSARAVYRKTQLHTVFWIATIILSMFANHIQKKNVSLPTKKKKATLKPNKTHNQNTHNSKQFALPYGNAAEVPQKSCSSVTAHLWFPLQSSPYPVLPQLPHDPSPCSWALMSPVLCFLEDRTQGVMEDSVCWKKLSKGKQTFPVWKKISATASFICQVSHMQAHKLIILKSRYRGK